MIPKQLVPVVPVWFAVVCFLDVAGQAFSFDGPVDQTAQPTDRKPGPVICPAEIAAGLKSRDRALFIKAGWIRDPYITVGPDGLYYLTGTQPNEADPREQQQPYNTGLGPESIVGWECRVYRSSDLINWESLDAPFTLKDGIWAKARPKRFGEVDQLEWRLWAPELHWLGDRWALVHTSPSPVKGANLSLTAGAEVARPWSNPMGSAIQKRHDPSLFKDDDGTWWMIWGATSIAPLKPDFTGFAAEPVTIGPTGETAKMGHEGCLMHKIDGKYVLFGTGWSTGEMRKGSYNLYYATADKIDGPYSERKFAGRFLGHGTPFKTHDGNWWCTAFFNGNVPPVEANGVESVDLSATAHSLNEQGTTIVPLDVKVVDGEVIIRAIPSPYSTIGPDEAQKFE